LVEIVVLSPEGGAGRPLREAALARAPRVEVDPIVLGEQRDRALLRLAVRIVLTLLPARVPPDRLEDGRVRSACGAVVGRPWDDPWREVEDLREKLRVRRQLGLRGHRQ